MAPKMIISPHFYLLALILRGLDALTTEDNIKAALALVSSVAIKNAQVVRDTLTGTSHGYAFIELSSLADSTLMLRTIKDLQTPFEVDGKAIIVAFAKNTFSTTM